MKRFLFAAWILVMFCGLVYGQESGSSFALSFDGQDDFVEIADSPILSGGPNKSLTLEYWVQPSTISGNFPLVHKWLNSKWKDWGMSVENGRLNVAIEANGDNWEYSAGAIAANVWTHVAFTFNNSNKSLHIYVNGLQVGPGATRSAGMPDTNAKVFIGKHGYNTAFFPGLIDEVRVWNFAKTASEIQSQMNQTLSGFESGLIGYWNFEDGSGATANDASGMGNRGQLLPTGAGPAWVVSDAPISATATLRVLSPNGGESWQAGNSQTITWTASAAISAINIEFSSDGGSSFSPVVLNTANDGSHNWVVPNTLSTHCLIRISDAAAGDPVDISDAPFSVVSAPPAELTFTDITLSAGTGGPTASGFTGGHAAIFADVTGDDLPDLYHTMLYQHPMKDLFFRNAGGSVFVDEADLRGVADYDSGSHGAVFADLDNDGDYDLYNGTTYATPGFPANNNLFRNDGSGFFTDVSAQSGMPFREWPTRAVLAFDMDNDADLDLLAITNFAGSSDPPDERNELYRNDGDMQFTAINSGDLYTAPAGQGATAADYDNDGDLDVFAANRNGDLNILRNDGAGNFTAVSPATIGISHQGRDGITLDDLDNDGDLDLLLTGPLLTGEPDGHLYMNNGHGIFTFRQSFVGISGYMGAFADLDHDGDLDLVFAGNEVSYLNDGLGNFSAGPSIPVAGIDDPRAIGFADIDGDGDLDFAIGAKRSRNWLVRNNFNGGNWLKVKLYAPNGQAGAFGARLKIYPAGQLGGQLLAMREARSVNGYLGQSDPVLHFGLGSYSAVDLQVRFLNGTVVTQTNVAANQTIVINPSGPLPSPPSIVSFTPTSGGAGTEVTITGANLSGATEVSFNGVAADFNVDSDTQIRATAPAGAASGPIRVTTPNGSALTAVNYTFSSSSTTIILQPTDDTFGGSSNPNKNYNHSPELRVRERSSSIVHAFLKFNVTGIGGPVQSAILRLKVLEESSSGGKIYSVSNFYQGTNTPWTESGLVWNNAPEISGSPLDEIGAVEVGQIVEFNVTAAINGDGVYSFGIKGGSSDILKYEPREGSSPPELIIVAGAASKFAAEASDSKMAPQLLGETGSALPRDFYLAPNYPNPFNAETIIEYTLPKAARVRLIIYNIKGQEVIRLVDEQQTAGVKKVRWDGRDRAGGEVAAGVYFLRLEAKETILVRRITLQK